MPNPYFALAAVLAVISIFFAGVSVGYKWESRTHAAAVVAAQKLAADRARQDAETEFQAAAEQTRKAEKARQASQAKRYNLELELAHDEAARNCRVSDGAFRVLNDAIDAANGVTSEAGHVDGAGLSVPEAKQPDGSGPGAGPAGWLGRIRALPHPKASLDRLDQ